MHVLYFKTNMQKHTPCILKRREGSVLFTGKVFVASCTYCILLKKPCDKLTTLQNKVFLWSWIQEYKGEKGRSSFMVFLDFASNWSLWMDEGKGKETGNVFGSHRSKLEMTRQVGRDPKLPFIFRKKKHRLLELNLTAPKVN